jgi:hypothetical protein
MGKANSGKNQFGTETVYLERNGKFTQLKWQMTAKVAGSARNELREFDSRDCEKPRRFLMLPGCRQAIFSIF